MPSPWRRLHRRLPRRLLLNPSLDNFEIFRAPPLTKKTTLFFAHIPGTGGSAVSWHLAAIFEASGGVVEGSQHSASFHPAHENQWRQDMRTSDGATAFKVAFGHASPGSRDIAEHNGSLRFSTMVRSPRRYAIHGAKRWLCPVLAKQYQNWWPKDGAHKIRSELWKQNAADTGVNRPLAPEVVVAYCDADYLSHMYVNYQPTDPPFAAPPSAMQMQYIRYAPKNPAHRGSSEAPQIKDASQKNILPGALKNLADMPWFGILENWGGSLCLLHYATEWRWPIETRAVCGADAENFDWEVLTSGPAFNEDVHHPSLWTERDRSRARENSHKVSFCCVACSLM